MATKQSFTWDDINQWVDNGLITPEQLGAIKQHVAQTTPPEQPNSSLNLLSVAYYFGAFIILLAYTFFMSLTWFDLGAGGQFAVALGSMVALVGLGAWLKRTGITLGGNLLMFAGVGITPLVVFTIQRVLGIWPDVSSISPDELVDSLHAQWLVIEFTSLAAALLGLWLTRFPLMMLLVSFWAWCFSLDVVRILNGESFWSWGLAERITGLLVAAAMLLVGVWLQRRRGEDYSLWLYVAGNLIVTTHLASLAFEYEGLVGLLFLLVSIGQVVASVLLQRRVFLVFGALGCYAYVTYLAFQVFDGVLGFSFALAAVGLFIVLSAVLFQKVLRPMIAQRIGPQSA